MRVKVGTDLRSISDLRVKVGNELRAVNIVVGRFGADLRVIWRRSQDEEGWVFTQGRPISVSGRFIRLNGQK